MNVKMAGFAGSQVDGNWQHRSLFLYRYSRNARFLYLRTSFVTRTVSSHAYADSAVAKVIPYLIPSRPQSRGSLILRSRRARLTKCSRWRAESVFKASGKVPGMRISQLIRDRFHRSTLAQ